MSKPGDPGDGLDGLNILLGVSGGIAAYKAAHLVRLLRKAGAEVVVTMTESASRFIAPLTLATLSGRPVVTSLWEQVHIPELPSDVEHIGLVKWADFAVMAPATMNFLGKLAGGLADDPPSTFFAAYPPARSLLAPAMNTGMWENAATRENIARLRERGYRTVGPDEALRYYDLAEELGVGRLDQSYLEKKRAEAFFALGEPDRAAASLRTAYALNPRLKGAKRITEKIRAAVGADALAPVSAEEGVGERATHEQDRQAGAVESAGP